MAPDHAHPAGVVGAPQQPRPLRGNPLSPALRSGPTAGSGAARHKQIPSSHDVYVIRDATSGRLLHFGETGRGFSVRLAEHERFYAKEGIDIIGLRLDTVEGKAAAKELERRYIDAYRRLFGSRPLYNHSNH